MDWKSHALLISLFVLANGHGRILVGGANKDRREICTCRTPYVPPFLASFERNHRDKASFARFLRDSYPQFRRQVRLNQRRRRQQPCAFSPSLLVPPLATQRVDHVSGRRLSMSSPAA